MLSRDELSAALVQRLARATEGDREAVLGPDAGVDLRALTELVRREGGDVEVASLLGLFHWARYQRLPEGQDQADLVAACEWLAWVLPWQPDLIPRPLYPTVAQLAPPAGPGPHDWSAEAVRLLRSRAGDDPHIIDRAIGLVERALAATPPGHPDRAGHLLNLCGARRARFERLGDRADADAAVAAGRQAVELMPAQDPNAAGGWSNLGLALRARFERTGDRVDIDAAVDALRAAVAASSADPADPAEEAVYLANAANALRIRFERTGDAADLAEAIDQARRAIDLAPIDDPNAVVYRSTLGGTLHRCVRTTGEDAALSEAIDVLRAAVRLARPGAPVFAIVQSNLGAALWVRFERTGALVDLDDAITSIRLAVEHTPADHPTYAAYQINLSGALQTRFERMGDLTDLSEAIGAGRRAVELTPADHPDLADRLNILGLALQNRFDRLGDLADLSEAIETGRRAVSLTPAENPEHAAYQSSLGLALRERFERLGAVADIDAAIVAARVAVDRTPAGHPQRAGRLSNLGLALRARFERFGDLSDIAAAITVAEEAVALTAPDHPGYARRLSNLGRARASRFERSGDPADLDGAAAALLAGLGSVTAAPSMRVRCGWRLGLLLAERDWTGARRAWTDVLDLLPQVLDRSLSRGDRQHLLRDFAGVATAAAAAALQAGQPDQAWEALEQGRGVLLAQTLATVTDPELQRAYPELAAEVRRLREDLNADHDTDREVNTDRGATGDGDGGIDPVARRRRAAAEWMRLVEVIRAQPGFDRFALPPTIASLRSGIDRGDTMVAVNVTPWRSDALILNAEGADHLRLVDLDAREAVRRANRFVEATLSPEPDHDEMRDVLAWLWDTVAAPILDHLGHRDPRPSGPWPRVWWMPTGPMSVLPLHAAERTGVGAADHVGVLDLVVSSYAPTVHLLSRARRFPLRARAEGRALVLGLADAEGQAPLPFAEPEAYAVASQVGAESVLIGASATRARVRADLAEAEWIHVAGHGVPADDPAESHLLLWDGPLPVREIANLELPQARLAYLSACATAFGGTTFLDESIHIASAFQAAGFTHVVATLWTVTDRHAPRLAQDFYRHLGRDGDPALAAHLAVRALRSRFPRHPYVWAPYVHLGP
jgi:tetratricopeptide (TPR) repeat protein